MVLSKQVSYRYHDKRKSPINGLFTPFMKLCLLFKLDFGNYILYLIKLQASIFGIIILKISTYSLSFWNFCQAFLQPCISIFQFIVYIIHSSLFNSSNIFCFFLLFGNSTASIKSSSISRHFWSPHFLKILLNTILYLFLEVNS